MDFIRTTTLGQVLHHASGRRWLRNADESDVSILATYVDREASKNLARWGSISSRHDLPYTDGTSSFYEEPRINIASGAIIHEKHGKDIFLVKFTEQDSENPRNWSTRKRAFVTAVICFYTTSVYIGSSLWSSMVHSVVEEFSVAQVIAQLGTSLFLLGLGIGPMFFSPLAEIPRIGMNNIYLLTNLLFVLCQLPILHSNNLSTMLVFRFITGILASPCLAQGGASIKAMYSARDMGIPMAIWDTATAVATFSGPIMGNYAAEYRGYLWPMWISFWFSAAGLLSIVSFLPETSPGNILYRRARRLRVLTGNNKFVSTSELANSNTTFASIAKDSLIKPLSISFKEPVVLVLNSYLALVYSLLFAALESYSVIFIDIYGFSPPHEGLTFLGGLTGSLLALAVYAVFYHFYQQKLFSSDDKIKPEERLLPAFVSAFLVPIGLLWFGWSARPDVHWIMPVIGGAFIGPSSAGLFFAIMNYLPDAYPTVSSSVLAGNSLMRSVPAAALPLFITPMYKGLGPGWASTVWAVLGCLFAPAPFLLYRYGGRIRLKSPRARHDF
ncbi:GTPase-activating protein [Lithohypha guttulata]|nr:GTPase-activating protein [Lithohypha guttulata]